MLQFALAQLANAVAVAASPDAVIARALSVLLSASAVTLAGNIGSERLPWLRVLFGVTVGGCLALAVTPVAPAWAGFVQSSGVPTRFRASVLLCACELE